MLFLNNKPAKCGVYQFGKSIGDLLQDRPDFFYFEVDSQSEAEYYIRKYQEDLVVCNYHPAVTRWLNADVARYFNIAITAHDAPQNWPGVRNIHLDPDFEEYDLNFKICRPIVKFNRTMPVIPNSIGSFGFGFGHKHYEELVQIVNREFDEAVIRLHIPFSDYVDPYGNGSRFYAQRCREENKKSGIRLEITHDYMSESELLNWLSQNSINCFIFNGGSAGCSSSLDWAISVRQPIAINDSVMFRHLRKVEPSIHINRGLKTLIEQGFDPIAKITDGWNCDTLWADFERIKSWKTA